MAEKMECIVHVVSRSSLQNELLVSHLKKTTCLEFKSTVLNHQDRLVLPTEIACKSDNGQKLIILDCSGIDRKCLADSLKTGLVQEKISCLLALINVDFNPAQDREEKVGFEIHAVLCGVRGVFFSQDSLELISKGIGKILEGEFWVSRLALSTAFQSQIPKRVSGNGLLSGKERNVLFWMAGGYGNPEIADQMSISVNTVKTHVHRIYKKLGISGKRGEKKRFAAILWAKQNL